MKMNIFNKSMYVHTGSKGLETEISYLKHCNIKETGSWQSYHIFFIFIFEDVLEFCQIPLKIEQTGK